MENGIKQVEQQKKFSLALGKRVLMLRKQAGLSQEAVARRAEISLNGYKNIERGRLNNGKPTNPSAFTLIAVANAFNMTLNELLDFDRLNVP